AYGHQSEKFVPIRIDDPDAVSLFIRRRQRIFINAGAGYRRPTQSDEDILAVRSDMDSSGPFSQRQSGDHLVVGGVDYAQVARGFVGDIDSDGGFPRGYGSATFAR